MNDVQILIDRQLGIYCRLNYDNVLKRLVVDGEESFYGLQGASVVANFDQDPPIFACRFSEAPGFEHILALANEDGRVAIQDTSSVKTASSLESFQCHNNAVFDLAWMPGHMNFVTVSGDHTACLWDVGGGAPRRVSVFSSHTRSVKTCAFRPDAGASFATGARDGHVLVWDVRASATPAAHVLRPDNCLTSCHSSVAPRTPGSHGKRARLDAPRALSVTGLAFRDDVTLLSAGECDGNIKAWDLRKNYSAYRREPLPVRAIPYGGSSAKNGYTNLVVDAARTRLYASCMDDVIYCFNVSAYNALPERRYVGHENGTFYIKTGLSPDGNYLVSGSSDKNAYVWNVRSSEPVVKLCGHRAEVTCAAWCQRGDLKIVTCSDDARHKIWRVGREVAESDAELQGRAEAGARLPAVAPPAWGALERTPSVKRSGSVALGALSAHGGAKRARSGTLTSRNTKRCLTPALNATREEDEPESGAKRPRPEPEVRPRLAAGVKRPHDATDAWSYEPRAGTSFLTPTKHYEPRSCRRVSLSPDSPSALRVISFSTPTKDLPDFVMRGEAPHLRLMSPPHKKPETTDWLTRMSLEKRALDSGKAPRMAPLSPKENLPPRRNSLSTDKTSKPAKKSRTLLKYFTIARKEK